MSLKENFCPLPLSRIKPGFPIPGDIFLFIDKKYIKFKSKGDIIVQEKLDSFLAQSLSCFYVENNSFSLFIDWFNSIKNESIKQKIALIGKENSEAIKKDEEIREKVYETFSDQPLDIQKVTQLQEQVGEVVGIMKKSPIVLGLLGVFENSGKECLLEHSQKVANMATFMAMTLGHGHQFILENVYLGGLFHDYGLVKTFENFLDLRKKQDAFYLDHPALGHRILSKSKVLPHPVLEIVLQHHEQYDGAGYPQQLKGEDIYDLAQIVSMASYFDTLLMSGEERLESRAAAAIRGLYVNKGRLFNPRLVERVVEALNTLLLDSKLKVA